MKVEVVNPSLPDFQGDARLVKAEDGRHFVVSGVNALFSGWEVLVFPADEKGEVSSFIDVAGGRGITHEEAIADLERVLSEQATAEPPTGQQR